MSVLKKTLLGLLVLVALLVLIGLFLPSTVHVERSAVIDNSPAKVFALVNGFRSFNKWSPWAERDPATEYVFEGPDDGVGAKMSWASENPQVGTGFQQITLSEPDSRVETHLDFGPQGTAEAFFLLEPTESGTHVTWGFDTDFGFNLVSRYLGLMFDNWIGADYEAGLANLESMAESLPPGDWTGFEIEVVEVEPSVIVFAATSSSWDVAAIGQALVTAYGQIGGFIADNKLEVSGQPLAITTARSEDGWQFDAGIPIAERPAIEIDPDSPVQIGQSPAGKTVRGVSIGSYSQLSANWDKVRAWVAAHGYEEAGPLWEQYVSDPGDTPEEELITNLYFPVR
jgi:effector-binding domain-containing protein